MQKTLILLFIGISACSPVPKALSLEEKLNHITSKPSLANVLDPYLSELHLVDCNQIDQILYDIYESDQEVRHTGELMEETDHANLISVLSILKNCGIPTLRQLSSTESRNAIPLVLQHQPNQDIGAYFLPQIRKGVEEGVFFPTTLALMIDRQMMFNGYKQIFGTQFVKGQLYELENPEGVQQRRDSVGFYQSFENLLDNYGLTLEEALANPFSVEELQSLKK